MTNRIWIPKSQIVPLPESMGPLAAAMLEPLARPRLLERVALLGAGPIGLLILQALKAAGAGDVHVVEPLEHRRAVALGLGSETAVATVDDFVRGDGGDASRGPGEDAGAVRSAGGEPSRLPEGVALPERKKWRTRVSLRKIIDSPENSGWGGRIRTSAWRNQNPLPYRLATPQLSADRQPAGKRADNSSGSGALQWPDPDFVMPRGKPR
jgi:hypothetical protein